MARFEDLVKYESSKPERTIRLVRSGNFYRAYNQSAWLFTLLITDYAVLRKYIKSLESNVFYIGFPVSVLLERISGRRYEQTNKGYDIYLKDDEQPDESKYNDWCATIITESKEHEGNERRGEPHFRNRRELEAHIIKHLEQFPLMNSTPKQCLDFLYDMQQLLFNNKYEFASQ